MLIMLAHLPNIRKILEKNNFDPGKKLRTLIFFQYQPGILGLIVTLGIAPLGLTVHAGILQRGTEKEKGHMSTTSWILSIA